MKKATVLAVLFLSGMILAPGPVQPYRVYFAPPAPANMQPGNMDQPDFWSKAPGSSQFRQLRSGKKAEHPTVFHATYNQNGLFLKTVCSEPEAAKLNFTDLGRKKDDASSFDGPVVEVFIDPAFTRKHSAHFAANINGTIFDRLDSEMIWEYPFSAKAVPAKDKKSFTIYFFIPWRETTNENPDSGYLFFMNLTDHPVIGFNIARERNCSVNEYSQWMVSAKTFMEPANYGAVVFSGCPNSEKRLLTLLDRWRPDNPSQTMPRAVFSDPNKNNRTSDRFLEPGDYLRIKNITIGYTLPKKYTKKALMDEVRFSVSGQNLYTLTRYTGMDPEVGGSGIDSNVYPLTRNFTFGLNIVF